MPEKRQRLEEAVFLGDDPIGVDRERKTRSITVNGNSFSTSINPSWLRQLGIGSKGEPMYHSLITGRKPVVVTEPAVIIQPAAVIGDD